MSWIEDVNGLRDDLERRVSAYFNDLNRALEGQDVGLDDRLRRLARLRSLIYEAMNQLQHEYLLVRAVEWLTETGQAAGVSRWAWHPTSTGFLDEPDLLGLDDSGKALVCAEATTSTDPKGFIDQRMKHTLTKLSALDGRRYYFVVSAPMLQRAKTKIAKAEFEIEAVMLSNIALQPLPEGGTGDFR